MKVKDLVDVVNCEVIIEREVVTQDIAQGKSRFISFTCTRFFKGVLDNCPEDILEYHVNYLLPEFEDVLTIRIL